jgi:hypothetical protein
MARDVIHVAAISGAWQTLWNITMAILLTLVELLLTALVVAPRYVARRLVSLVRAPLQRLERTLTVLLPRREPAHPSRDRP